jgi:hypothetical protein
MPSLAHDMLRHDMLKISRGEWPAGAVSNFIFLKRGSKIRERCNGSLAVTVGVIKLSSCLPSAHGWAQGDSDRTVLAPHVILRD